MRKFFTRNFRLLRWPTAVIIGLCLSLAFIVPICAQQATEPTTKTAEPNYANDPYWQHAKQEVYKSVLELMAQHQNELLQGIQYHKLTHGNVQRKQIALTFNDGPHPLYTPQILDILAKEKVRATFFVIGEMADKYPNLVQAELTS